MVPNVHNDLPLNEEGSVTTEANCAVELAYPEDPVYMLSEDENNPTPCTCIDSDSQASEQGELQYTSGDDTSSIGSSVESSGNHGHDCLGYPNHCNREMEPVDQIFDHQHADDDGDDDKLGEDDMNKASQPILPGSELSVGQVVTMIFAYALKHSLTKLAIQDLLKLIDTIVGPSNIPGTLFMLNKYIQSAQEKIKVHFYCPACLIYIGEFANEGLITCSNCNAQHSRCDLVKEGTFFLVSSLKSQLTEIFDDSVISQHLSYKQTRQKLSPNNIEDIFDGRVYKSVPKLRSVNNISMMWNTNGVPVFKSSKVSMWPIQCIINELPPTLRKENLLLCGLWFGEGKPDPTAFLKPFTDECNDLAENGFSWKDQESGAQKTSKVFTLICTCDSVARCALQNLKQFNGKFGCSWCLQEGQRVEKGRGFVQVYPYLRDPAQERNVVNTVQSAEDAVRVKEPVNGVKGPSILMLLTAFDIINGFPVDYLHNSLLGVTRYFGSLWLDSKNHDAEYYVGNETSKIDEKLTSIKPPNNLSRAPRSITIMVIPWWQNSDP
ncbi:uncharacterized protein LOC110989402 isoform X2 [Acanthaster planci]|uniref:Uncharacterized protein LOC110989402 isoform X2 n=1 Tax=Acanthaster planci TaxID=133434 RepID=A0A8B7ZV87_ACAPL|nr:uncharacterized protein LOC110989402 isoform X2 [Acanthaster planci]